ncbi:unnamed protein product [Phytophthora fragariaefolia]|uniref:Unnamed protein product n=1 Tax=Phytophthora fragariaefolia TaxID=1490495 RepID=A0A9W6Y669_9STRA|nr:unnamed protein product [Phytophthora fragariaefolia]
MSDKPYRYGSKQFMTSNAKTSYCQRFEVYVRTRADASGTENTDDYKDGAAAVVLNLKVVLADPSRHKWHAVDIDRYYSSVLLAVELLNMNVYAVGTVMTNRLGIDQNIKTKCKSRPASIRRSTFTCSRSTAIPSLLTYIWWDRKPVYYLCAGSVMTGSSIERKVKRVGPMLVPCPPAVNDYQNWTGGCSDSTPDHPSAICIVVSYDIGQSMWSCNADYLTTLARKPAESLYTYPQVEDQIHTNTKY